MNRRQSLGQHFLVSDSIAKSIVDFAKITKNDTVLEIGTGKGILIPFLCQAAKNVISVERDKKLYLLAQQRLPNFSNLSLKHGDAFKMNVDFTVLVSNLPYSKSREAIEWLVQKKFRAAIIMVQKEFAQKLLSKPGSKNHRAISVLVNYSARIEPLMEVSKSNFFPAPKVDSIVLRLTKKHNISKKIIDTLNKLFSYRRKTIRNIAKQFRMSIDSNKRLEDLTDGEIIKLAKEINRN